MAKTLMSLYADQMVGEFNAIMDWKEIIEKEINADKKEKWIHYAEEEHKHYMTLRSCITTMDEIASTLAWHMDDAVAEVMECILKHKKTTAPIKA